MATEEAPEETKVSDRGMVTIPATLRRRLDIILETLNWIHNWKHHAKAVETYERLTQSAGFEVLHAAQKDFRQAVELFETYDGLSFGDATIVGDYLTGQNDLQNAE
jgi:hypothetical protein